MTQHWTPSDDELAGSQTTTSQSNDALSEQSGSRRLLSYRPKLGGKSRRQSKLTKTA